MRPPHRRRYRCSRRCRGCLQDSQSLLLRLQPSVHLLDTAGVPVRSRFFQRRERDAGGQDRDEDDEDEQYENEGDEDDEEEEDEGAVLLLHRRILGTCEPAFRFSCPFVVGVRAYAGLDSEPPSPWRREVKRRGFARTILWPPRPYIPP